MKKVIFVNLALALAVIFLICVELESKDVLLNKQNMNYEEKKEEVIFFDDDSYLENRVMKNINL